MPPDMGFSTKSILISPREATWPSWVHRSRQINARRAAAWVAASAVSGDFLVDGEPLTTERLDALRRVTAWVDPTVHIWNRSLLENLVYGSGNTDGVGTVLEMAGLLPVVAKLPQGLATFLGEGGALLSAGEAQRVTSRPGDVAKNTASGGAG